MSHCMVIILGAYGKGMEVGCQLHQHCNIIGLRVGRETIKKVGEKSELFKLHLLVFLDDLCFFCL